MKRKTLGILIVTAFLTWGCAGTTTTEAEGAEAAKTANTAEPEQVASKYEKDPDELICKRIKKTGSMLTTKVCATREEWKESEENMPQLFDSKDLY